MNDILHRIQIAAPPGRVYEAITASEGLKRWWTADSKAESRVGGEAQFGFHNRAVVFRMRIDALEPGKHVAWTCVGGDDEWEGTQVTFELDPKEEGTILDFAHKGWRSVSGGYPTCNAVWGYLMHNLRDFAEGKETSPYFTE